MAFAPVQPDDLTLFAALDHRWHHAAIGDLLGDQVLATLGRLPNHGCEFGQWANTGTGPDQL